MIMIFLSILIQLGCLNIIIDRYMSQHKYNTKMLNQSISQLSRSRNSRTKIDFDFTLQQIQYSNEQHFVASKSMVLHQKQQPKKLSSHKNSIGKQNKHCKNETFHSSESKVGGLTYVNITKSLEQKNMLILKQREEIDILKKHVEDIKNNNKILSQEEEKIREQQLNRLKKCQVQHSENLKELSFLRQGIRQMKSNYDQLFLEKEKISKKYQEMFNQNQQLTIVINSLKDEIIKSEQLTEKHNILQNQFNEMKEKHQSCSELEIQKNSIQDRCMNFEKKLNDYILKYNEIQGHYNEAQIKYYKIQKQCDNLKMDKEQSDHKLGQIQKQLKAQRDIHSSEQLKLKTRIKKYEEEAACLEQKLNDFKYIEQQHLNQNQQIEKWSKEVFKLKQENKKLREQLQLQIKKWERYLKQMTKSFNIEKQQINNIFAKKMSQFQRIYEQKIVNLNQEIQNYQTAFEIKNKTENCNKEYIIRLQSEINNLQISIAEIKQREDCLNKQRVDYINKFQQRMKKIRAQNDRITDQLALQKTNHHQTLSHYQDETKRLLALIKAIENQNIEKQNDIQELTDKHSKDYQFLMYQNQILSCQNNSLTDIINIEKNKNKKIYQQKQETISLLEDKIQKLILQVNEKEQNLKIQKLQRGRVQGERSQYSGRYQYQIGQYNNLSKYLCQLEADYANLAKNNNVLLLDFNHLQAEYSILKVNLNQTTKLLNDLKEQNGELVNKNKQLNLKASKIQKSLSEQINEYQKIKVEIKSIEQENLNIQQGYQKEIRILKKEFDTIKVEKQEIEKQIQAMNKYSKSLGDKCSTLQNEQLRYVSIHNDISNQLQINQQSIKQLVDKLHFQKNRNSSLERELSEIRSIQIKYIETLQHQKMIIQNMQKSIVDKEYIITNFLQYQQSWQKERKYLEEKYVSQMKALEKQKKAIEEDLKIQKCLNEKQRKNLCRSHYSVSYDLDNSQTTIDILRNENMELNKMMTEQLEKRNNIIKELMKEKKALYCQLNNKWQDKI